MSALEPFKDKMTIINGLSARMAADKHGAGFGAMGAYKSYTIPLAETIDGALANAHPGVFKHLGFKLHENTKTKIDRPFVTAFGSKKPGSFYCDPAIAYGELFGAIATDKDVKARQDGDKVLLDFMVDDVKRFQSGLNSAEKEKLDHYLGAYESLAERRSRLFNMADTIQQHAPEYSDKYSSDVEVHRLEAHFEMAATAIIAGLTNVLTLRVDELTQFYHGLGIDKWNVHTVGHVEGDPRKWADRRAQEEMTGVEARRRIRKAHFDLIGQFAQKLNAVPEGDGTMLDNTLIVVLSDHGSLHHPTYNEFPFITIGNVGGALKANGRYLHYPNTNYSGNRTIGSFYTTLMHAAGAPRDGFGQLDPRLSESDQKAPLAELLA